MVTMKEGGVAKWTVKYNSYPILKTLVWRDTRGNDIRWSNEPDRESHIEAINYIDRKQASIVISKLTMSDSGFYTLFADNGKINKTQKFELRVEGI